MGISRFKTEAAPSSRKGMVAHVHHVGQPHDKWEATHFPFRELA
jgi:hypothetical protein